MPNPIQKIIELAKKGDRRVILGGALVVGGGVGLAVYLRNKNAGPGGTSNSLSSTGSAGSGGGGGGGTSDSAGGSSGGALGEDLGLSLPTLPDLSAAFAPQSTPDLGVLSTPDYSAAAMQETALPAIPEITAGPAFGGFPSLPNFDTGLPSLPGFGDGGLPGYTGGSFGNPVGQNQFFPERSGAASIFKQASKPVAAAGGSHFVEAPKSQPRSVAVQAIQPKPAPSNIFQAITTRVAAFTQPKPATSAAPIALPTYVKERIWTPAENLALAQQLQAKQAQEAIARSPAYYQATSYFGAQSPYASGFGAPAAQSVSRQPAYYNPQSYFGAASPYSSGYGVPAATKTNIADKQRTVEPARQITTKRVNF